MSMSLLDLTAQTRTIGRASVFYVSKWDGTTKLQDTLTHLGDTEGEISLAPNDEYSDLTLPELTGPAIHERYLSGLNPVLSIPIYLADPDIRAILTPAGSGSAGYQRRQSVTEYTLVIFPEQLFIESNVQVAVDFTTPSAWTVGGDAATAAQLALIDQSIWFWRGHFSFAPLTFRHEDAGKAVDTVNFHVMHADISTSYIPDGQRLFTLGDPADVSIEIDPAP